jgi:polyhydroxybutyrate depolymerase
MAPTSRSASALFFSGLTLAIACTGSDDSTDGQAAGAGSGGGDAAAGGGTLDGSSGGSDGSSTGGVAFGSGGIEAAAGGSDTSAGGGASSSGGGDASTGGLDASTGGGDAGTGGAPSRSAGCGTAPTLESGTRAIDVAGIAREYTLRLPDNYDMNQPYRLVFAFHAMGGNMGQVAGGSNNDYYGLFSRADDSAIFVSPNGIDAGWRNTDGRDVEFVKAMLAEFEADLCIDPGRIFATGFSFGGMMSNAIGCALADVFRAIAPMAGAIPNPDHLYSECNQVNDHPIAMWMAHGDTDAVVPYSDGLDALNLFLERAECGTETVAVSPSPCVAYQGCMPDYPIHLCEFSGGHSVPGFAAEGIWSFFEQF